MLQNKDHWERFSQAFNDVYVYDENKNFNGTIITGGAAGLYTTYEAILMVSSVDELWAAYLYEGKVYYFTNSTKKDIHVEILNWSERFRDAEWIVFTKI